MQREQAPASRDGPWCLFSMPREQIRLFWDRGDADVGGPGLNRAMDIDFIAGFGPIGTADSASHDFWAGTLGIPFHENAPGYFHTEDVAGAKAFAIWPLAQAAEATFGTPEWPADRPVPQAWIEFDVAAPELVAPAVEELRAKGCEILVEAHLEPWGQTTSRVMSPEGLLVGVSYTPWMHGSGAPEGDARSGPAGSGAG